MAPTSFSIQFLQFFAAAHGPGLHSRIMLRLFGMVRIFHRHRLRATRTHVSLQHDSECAQFKT